MKEQLLINGEALNASLEGMLAVEEFLCANYLFRRNVLNGKIEQLYAQVLYELREQKTPYWFNNEEVARIQELNIEFAEKKDLAEILVACFRKPKEGEASKAMNCNQMMKVIQEEYPNLKINHSAKVHLGFALKELGYEFTNRGHVPFYKTVPLKALSERKLEAA